MKKVNLKTSPKIGSGKSDARNTSIFNNSPTKIYKKLVALLTVFVFTWSMCITPVMAETIKVEGGSIDVDVKDNTTNWNVTGNPVWNVPEFNVPTGNIYNIAGLGTGSSLALLVNGGSASNIFGTMNLSNLDFILQNIAGINIGASAMINLNNASLIASTLPLNTNVTDFLARQYEFSGQGGFLTNDGKIVGNNADLVALVANAIENKGTIEVPMGTVALAAGDTVTVGISGDGLVSIGVDPATANQLGLSSQIKNTGTLSADGGKVILNAQAMDGLFEKAISLEKGGNAVSAVTANNGTVEFQSMDDIYNSAVVEASGGTAKIVSTQGSVMNAGSITANQGRVEIASDRGKVLNEGTVKADHGVVKLTAEQAAYNKMLMEAIYGKIEVTVQDDGGRMMDDGRQKTNTSSDIRHPTSGNFVNEGTMDASHGQIELNAAGAVETKGVLKADEVTERGASFKMGGRIEVGTMDMDNLDNRADIVDGAQLSGNFTDEDDISVLGDFSLIGDTTIWTDSDGLNDDGTLTWAETYLLTGNGYDLTLKVSKNSTVGAITDVDLLTFDKNTGKTPTYTGSTSDDIDVNTISTEYGTTFSKDVTVGSDHMIYSASDAPGGLQYMDQNLGYNYKMANNIDASETVSWNSGAGFSPVKEVCVGCGPMGEDTATGLTGTFDGQNHTISGLSINRPTESYVGLLGSIEDGATVQNVGLLGGSITGSGTVGGLVGYGSANSTVTNSFNTGSVSGGYETGGLAGSFSGNITNSFAAGNVTGTNSVGGLVGALHGSVTNSYATGIVDGGSGSVVGGLVGYNNGAISNSYAMGAVSGNQLVGGLAGLNDDYTSIIDSYATGNVNGSNTYNGDRYIGGLVGKNGWNEGATITNSYATGNVTGSNDYVGGLTGQNQDNSIILNSYATGNVSAAGYAVGGLVGMNGWNRIAAITNSYSTGNVNGLRMVGGLVGYNSSGSTVTNSFSLGVASGTAGQIGGLIGCYGSGTLTNNWWYNATNLLGLGFGSSAQVTKASALSDFYGTGGGTGGAVYSGWNFTEGAGAWNSFAGALPHLDYEWSQNITTLLQLQNMNLNLSTNYTLANDIDASSTAYWNWDGTRYQGFNPIGGVSSMNFDGTGHAISNLTINRPGESEVGFFRSIQNESSSVSNLGLKNVNIIGSSQVGGLAGRKDYGAHANNVYVTGKVSGSSQVGGLVGFNYSGIYDSYSTAEVSGSSYVGGLVGYFDSGNIVDSYSTGYVHGGDQVGGLYGYTDGNADLENSYFAGRVEGNGSWVGPIGGLGTPSGDNRAPTRYGGGFQGAYYRATDKDGNSLIINNGGSINVMGTGLTYAQSTQQSSYTGWDFDVDGVSAGHNGVWIMAGTPHLQKEWSATITNAAQLQMMALDLDASYTLANNIDASDTVNWNAGAGFTPVSGYAGVFDGSDHVVDGLYMNRNVWGVGLFNSLTSTANIKNVGLTNVDIRGGSGVGALIGVTNNGLIEDCYSTGVVTGDTIVGGLIGRTEPHGAGVTVQRSYSLADVTGTGGGYRVGGFVGEFWGGNFIYNSYATGNVTSTGSDVGGFAGMMQFSTLENSYATGHVVGLDNVGGLVGNDWSGETNHIKNSFATGTVETNGGGTYLGGLVGRTPGASSILNSYFTDTAHNNGFGVLEAGGAAAFKSSSHAVYNGSSPWDFTNTWQSFSNALPHLQWENYTPLITSFSIAGLFDQAVSRLSIFLSLNGSNVGSALTAGDGSFSFSDIALSGGENLLLYVNGDATYHAGLIGEVQTAGDILGLALTNGRFTFGNTNGSGTSVGTSFNNADLTAAYDGNTALYNTTGGAINFASNVTVQVPASVTYVMDNSASAVNVAGNLLNQGVINQQTDLAITGGYTQETGATFAATSPDTNTMTVGGSFSIPDTAGAFNRFGQSGTVGSPYLIYDVYGLQGMKGYLASGTYFQLANNIDASGTTNWNSGAGFDPIGSGFWWLGQSGQFTGNFDGQNHTISDLYINRPSEDAVGLFGVVHSGTIENVGLVGGSVTGSWGTGGLAGGMWYNATLSNVYNTGSVTGAGCTGGLIGLTGTTGTISNAYATGNVSGTSEVGGLVGNTDSTQVLDSYATGNITGSGDRVGGLVGQNNNGSLILRSYATGNVSGVNKVGGLVGRNSTDAGTMSDIQDSYATGNVTGTADVGGLVGFNTESGVEGITGSYSHKIYNVLDLQLMQNDLDGNFTLMNDINASDTVNWNSALGFDPVGGDWQVNPFTGSLNGNSHAISGLTIDRPSESWIGLFGSLRGATVQDVSLENIDFAGQDVVGGIAGLNIYGATVSNASTTGTISGRDLVGGIAGRNDQSSTITGSHSSVNVSGRNGVGGLAGDEGAGAAIRNSYATGTVTGTDYVGGLVGNLFNWMAPGTIENSYATGTVTGTSKFGGLVGNNDLSGITGITSSYSHKIYNVLDLQLMQNDLDGSFTLMNDLDASATSSWNSGSGFAPIGYGSQFTGILDGQNHTISGLYIHRDWSVWPNCNQLGLFNVIGVSGVVQDVILTGVDVYGVDNIGTLAGTSYGLIQNVGVSGIISGTSGGGTHGGMMAANYGTIQNSYANVDVTGNHIGGLVGHNAGTISDSYAAGFVHGMGTAGGLVHSNAVGGSIINSYATGNVSATPTDGAAGGLVGQNSGGIISNSYATGNAFGGPIGVGGLVGRMNGGSISDSYSLGNASGNNPGGFIGAYQAGMVTDNFWNTETSGLSNAFGSGSTSGITGKTTTEMKQQSTFSGWDWTSVWRIYDGFTTPFLKSFLTPLTVTANAVSKVYDGTTNVTGNGVTYSIVPSAELKGTLSYTSSAGKNVGTYAGIVTPTGLYSTQQGYDITYVAGDLTITPKTLTVSATGTNKTYDGTTATTVTLSDNRIAGDVLTDAYTTAVFANKNVGTGKEVSVTGLSISGTDAGNYTLASTTAATTANITARTLTLDATGVNRVYDGTTVATVTLADDRVAGDVLTGSYTAAFDDKNVGTDKAVSVTGLSISGTDAGNYTLASTTDATSANITARTLTIAATGTNKVYDGTTAGSVTLSDNRVAGDVLIDAYTAATFDNKNVGTGKAVSVSGISISGADAANYSLASTSAATTANITQRTLTVSGTGTNKTYDGTTATTVTLSDNRVAGDVLTDAYTTAVFVNKNAGIGKAVNISGISISGTDAANYSLASTSAATTANITQRTLTVSATGTNKTYDGTTADTVTLSDNRIVGDVLTDAYTTASFSDKNVGTGKAVSVSGISISGVDAANYSLASTSATTSADITQRALTVSATGTNKTYDGTAAGTVTLSDNRVAGDVLTDTYTAATFADKNVGTGKTVSVSGISISGVDAANYSLASTSASTTANISAKALTISGVAASDKVYDATVNAALDTTGASLAGTIGGDLVSLNSGAASGVFADKNVGTSKVITASGFALSGADATNYSLSQPVGLTANITKATVTLSGITASNKTYDATTAATVSGGTFSGKYAGDVLTVASAGTFSDKNVAAGKTVTLVNTLGGADLGNYTVIDQGTTTADITKAVVTLSGITASNKVYDSTTAATVSGGTFSGKIGTDDLTVSSTGVFSDKNVAAGKTVTLTNTLGGADLGNYQVTDQGTTTADITKASAMLSGITASDKVYDATTSATVNTAGATFAGKYAGDELTVASTGVFNNKNVGTGKTVSLTNTLDGADLGNYNITDQATTTAAISKAAATLSGITAESKVYDGATAATVSTAAANFAGKYAGDDLTVASSGIFNNKNVGANKTVTLTNVLGGADLANYQITEQGTTAANITAIVTGAVSGIGSGISMLLAVTHDGAQKTYETTTDANGSFRFGGDLFVNTGDAMLLYINDGSHSANLVGTIAAPASVTNLTLVNGGVSIGSGNAINIAASYTNADLATAKGLLTNNINYGVSNNALTVSGADLYVPAGVTFTPGGNVAVTGDLNVAGNYAQNSNLAVTGDFVLASGSTFTDSDPLSHNFAVTGNFSVPYGASFVRYTGTGTANDPYLIRSVYDLQAMNNNLSSHFKLGANLDAASVASWNNNTGFDPIGDSSHAFTGSLNGNGKVISNLTVDRADTDYLGLFGNVGSTGSISTLGLENISIYGHEYVGGLAGLNAGSLSNVYTTGVHTVSGVNFVGGLVGGNTGSIANAYSSARVLGADKVGGLVGSNTESGTIQKTYAMGYVTGTSNAGGLVGANTSTAANSVSDSFWNISSSGRAARAGVTEGTGITATEISNPMISQGTYSGWNFQNIWVMDNGGSYPHFQFRYPEGVRGVGGVVYINSTLNDVTTQSKAGAGEEVVVSYSVGKTGDGTYLDATSTGADSSFYVVLGKNAVGSSDFVIGTSLNGTTRKQASSGSIYPLNIWASESYTFETPVMPDTPPVKIDTITDVVDTTFNNVVPDVHVTPIVTPVIIPIIDQTGPSPTIDIRNIIGGVSETPVTNPIVVPSQPAAPPATVPVAESQSPSVADESAEVAVEDTLDEVDVTFSDESSPGREPVPLPSESEGSSSGSSEVKTSEGEGNGQASTSESEGSAQKSTTTDESETSGKTEEAASSDKSDGKSANWRDVPITGFTGTEDAKKFLTDVRVIEGAVYVIDGANAMSLLGMGDSLRVFYKRKKVANSKRQVPAETNTLKPQMSNTQSSASAEPAVKQALEEVLKKAGQESSQVLAEPEATPAPEARVLKSAIPIVMGQTKSGERYGTLKNPGKDVFVKNPGGEWKPAKDGMVILPGDEVKTAESNSVDVLMDEGKTAKVEIKEGSLFRIQKAETDVATGAKSTILELAIGKILVKVESIKGNGKFEVRTPTALTGVRGTIFEVTVKEKV